MAEYETASKKKLQLKGVSELGIKKKKKRKEKQLVVEHVPKVEAQNLEKTEEQRNKEQAQIRKTKAELSFLQMQQKMQTERILQKASKTHKQRVEDFNRHLDTLTEHFDIPKVSWTK